MNLNNLKETVQHVTLLAKMAAGVKVFIIVKNILKLIVHLNVIKVDALDQIHVNVAIFSVLVVVLVLNNLIVW